VSKNPFELVQQFKANHHAAAMYSFKLLERVLHDQCNLTEAKGKPVELKKPKEIASDSLRNPSEPDAPYSGHKGQCYQVQIMETFSKKKKKRSKSLLI
jgi:hypothetical protein